MVIKFKKIIAITLAITLAFNLNVYAADSGSGAQGDVTIGEGSKLVPIRVLAGGLRFYIFDENGSLLGGKGIDVFPKFMDTNGKDWTVIEGKKNGYPWSEERKITPESTWKYSKFCPVFYGAGDSMVKETKVGINTKSSEFVAWYNKSFESYAYDETTQMCTTNFIGLMKDIGVFSLGGGIPADGDAMTTVAKKVTNADGTETESTQQVTKFEAWLRGFNSGVQNPDKRPFVICEPTMFTMKKGTYGTDGTNSKWKEVASTDPETKEQTFKETKFSGDKKLYLVTNKDMLNGDYIKPDTDGQGAQYLTFLTMPKTTDTTGMSAEDAALYAKMDEQKQIAVSTCPLYQYSSTIYAGIVSGWKNGGGSSGGGGGGGDDDDDDDPKFPDTGKSQDMILYEDELAYFYSLTNINLGTNRGVKVTVNDGQLHPIDLCGCNECHICTNKTSGNNFTITLVHTTTGYENCWIPGGSEAQGTAYGTDGNKTGGTYTSKPVTLTEGEQTQVVIAAGDINYYTTGFRDKSKDLRTPYPKYNSADVLADLKTFGIEEKTSTAYEPNSTNHMKDKAEQKEFNTKINIAYSATPDGETNGCSD